MKFCSGCNNYHNMEEFGRRSSSPDGYTGQCKKYLASRKRLRNRIGEFSSLDPEVINQLVLKEMSDTTTVVKTESMCLICGEFYSINELVKSVCRKCRFTKRFSDQPNYPKLFKEIDIFGDDKLSLLDSFIYKCGFESGIKIQCCYENNEQKYIIRIVHEYNNKENELFWFRHDDFDKIIKQAEKEITKIFKTYNGDDWQIDSGFAVADNYDLNNACEVYI